MWQQQEWQITDGRTPDVRQATIITCSVEVGVICRVRNFLLVCRHNCFWEAGMEAKAELGKATQGKHSHKISTTTLRLLKHLLIYCVVRLTLNLNVNNGHCLKFCNINGLLKTKRRKWHQEYTWNITSTVWVYYLANCIMAFMRYERPVSRTQITGSRVYGNILK